jgi:hypothetical protein
VRRKAIVACALPRREGGVKRGKLYSGTFFGRAAEGGGGQLFLHAKGGLDGGSALQGLLLRCLGQGRASSAARAIWEAELGAHAVGEGAGG